MIGFKLVQNRQNNTCFMKRGNNCIYSLVELLNIIIFGNFICINIFSIQYPNIYLLDDDDIHVDKIITLQHIFRFYSEENKPIPNTSSATSTQVPSTSTSATHSCVRPKNTGSTRTGNNQPDVDDDDDSSDSDRDVPSDAREMRTGVGGRYGMFDKA